MRRHSLLAFSLVCVSRNSSSNQVGATFLGVRWCCTSENVRR